MDLGFAFRVENNGELDLVEVLHAMPGRVRMHVRGLYHSTGVCRALEAYLCRPAWATNIVRANEKTSTLLVSHRGCLSNNDLVQMVQEWMQKAIQETLAGRENYAPNQTSSQQQDRYPAAEINRIFSGSLVANPEAASLSEQDVWLRQRTYGPNLLSKAHERSPTAIFLRQFVSLQVAVLAGGAVLALATGGVADAAMIGGVILVNGLIGFYTERNAERMISGLLARAPAYADVYRAGQTRRVPTTDLVPGDLLRLVRGEVPADLRLLKTRRLTVDESVLTGESEPVLKDGSKKPSSDPRHFAWKGTAVVGGSALALVVGIGRKTKVGEIHESMNQEKVRETPLQKQLDVLSKRTIIISGQICIAVAIICLARRMRPQLMLETVVSLAIAAIPEGLSTVGMICMARGASRMRRRGVHVRDLQALEALGQVDVLCLDKTGTLTENKMSVTEIRILTGRLTLPLAEQARHRFRRPLDRIARASALCREDWDADQEEVGGSSTEAAIAELVVMLGQIDDTIRSRYPLAKTKYRDESRPYMVTSHRSFEGGRLKVIKGSPTHVLDKCLWKYRGEETVPLTEKDREAVLKANREMAENALRVLALAEKRSGQKGYVYIGLVGMHDPPRDQAASIVAALQRAGIRTLLLTGDQQNTAMAIGQLTNINRVEDVYSRVTPTEKLKIVETLQAEGHIVAMVGDGINDGPALRRADVGIAVGGERNGVAAEAAQIVCERGIDGLLAAFEEGRSMRKSLSHAIQFMLSTNLSELMVTLGAIALTGRSPFSPLMLLWINMLTDVFPALAIATSASHNNLSEDFVKRRDAHSDFAAMNRDAFVLTIGILGPYLFGGKRATGQAEGGVFLGLTMNQMIYAQVLASKGERLGLDGWNHRVTIASCSSLALALASCSVPGLARMIGVSRVPTKDMARLTGVSFVTNSILFHMNKKGVSS